MTLAKRIQWREPTEVTERKLRDVTLPWLRKTFRRCTLYFSLAALILVPLGYYVNGPAFSLLAVSCLGVCIYQIPLLVWLNVRQGQKSGVTYQVGPKGVQVNRRFYVWRDVERYSIGSSALSADVRDLNLKVRQSKGEKSLPFSPGDVNEHELRAILERFVPSAASPAV